MSWVKGGYFLDFQISTFWSKKQKNTVMNNQFKLFQMITPITPTVIPKSPQSHPCLGKWGVFFDFQISFFFSKKAKNRDE